MKRSKRGFALAELLAVVAIIAVLVDMDPKNVKDEGQTNLCGYGFSYNGDYYRSDGENYNGRKRTPSYLTGANKLSFDGLLEKGWVKAE